jgi:ornithine cyclodeaminase
MADADGVLVLRRDDVRRCIDAVELVEVVRAALVAVADGEVLAPRPLSFHFEPQHGEAHVKGAYLQGADEWTVKLATGFYDNPQKGLPTASGMSLVASAETGELQAIIVDGGELTDVRTAAAGCAAVGALAPDRVRKATLVGCGIQARVQARYLLTQRQPESLVVYGRNAERAATCAREIADETGAAVESTDDVRVAVRGADVVITVTPAQSPVLEAGWLEPGATVVAVGSDMPGKNELDPKILRSARTLVADDPAQAARVGELQHAPDVVDRALPLGRLLASDERPNSGELAVADLTGLGAEDAAAAGLAVRRARELGVGEVLDVG